MEGAMSASEVSNALGLSALKSRTWSIFKTSATKGEGLDEAMEWWVLISFVGLGRCECTANRWGSFQYHVALFSLIVKMLVMSFFP